MNIFTSFASEDNLRLIIENNYLPIIILRNIRNSKCLNKYSDTCIHFRELSPSTELFQSYKNNEIDVEEYHYRYILELLDRNLNTQSIYKEFIFLNNLVSAKGLILLGYEEDPHLCHRSALAEFLGRLWNCTILEWNGS